LGVISEANITDWTLTLIEGGDSFTLFGPLSGNNSQVVDWFGGGLTASTTGLYFDFSAGDMIIFQNPNIGSSQNVYCLQGDTIPLGFYCGIPSPGELVAVGSVHDGLATTNYEGQQLIASAVPEPATLAILGLGFAGLGFSRRRKLN